MFKFIITSAILLHGPALVVGTDSYNLQRPLTIRTCLPELKHTPGNEAVSNFPDCTRDPLCSNNVCDESISAQERAAALVAELTIWEKLDNLVNEAPGVPRLGIPPYEWWSEGLHGVASSPGTKFAAGGNFSYATSFPQPIILGSAFDDELVRAVGEVVSKEARAFSNDGRSGLDLYVSA